MKKRLKEFSIVSITVLLWVLGLGWLAVLIIAMSLSYGIVMKGIPYIKPMLLRKICTGVFTFVFFFSIAIGVRVFVFDIYKIPSASMENTLYPGDVILVNKLQYGPKLPRSPFEISWVNIAFYLNDAARKKMGIDWWGYKRFSGISKIKQGDVFVFHMDFSKRTTLVKRCVGLAGDELEIKKGKVYINGVLYTEPDLVKNRYRVQIPIKKLFYRQLDSLGLDVFRKPAYELSGILEAALTNEELKKVNSLKGIDPLWQVVATKSNYKNVYPKSKKYSWTMDNFGPFKIPKKGMRIPLNEKTVALYKKVIKKYEKQHLKKTTNGYVLNGKKQTSYVFQQDYFFMMGDYRKESQDSRRWGVVPEKNIIGKTDVVLFNYTYGDFNWKRFLKGIE